MPVSLLKGKDVLRNWIPIAPSGRMRSITMPTVSAKRTGLCGVFPFDSRTSVSGILESTERLKMRTWKKEELALGYWDILERVSIDNFQEHIALVLEEPFLDHDL